LISVSAHTLLAMSDDLFYFFKFWDVVKGVVYDKVCTEAGEIVKERFLDWFFTSLNDYPIRLYGEILPDTPVDLQVYQIHIFKEKESLNALVLKLQKLAAVNKLMFEKEFNKLNTDVSPRFYQNQLNFGLVESISM